MPKGCGVEWAECSLIIGTGCRVQVFSLILDSSVGLSAGIQSAGDLVSETTGAIPAKNTANAAGALRNALTACNTLEGAKRFSRAVWISAKNGQNTS